MLYRCVDCGHVMAYPFTRTEHRPDADGFTERITTDFCPWCGSTQPFDEVEECCCQVHYKDKDEHLCPHCKAELKKAFGKFVTSLTPDAREQLDDWLDGMSIGSWPEFE